MSDHNWEPGDLPQPVPAAGTTGVAWSKAWKSSNVAQEWEGAAEPCRTSALGRGCSITWDAARHLADGHIQVPVLRRLENYYYLCGGKYRVIGPCVCLFFFLWVRILAVWHRARAAQGLGSLLVPLSSYSVTQTPWQEKEQWPWPTAAVSLVSELQHHSHWCSTWKSTHFTGTLLCLLFSWGASSALPSNTQPLLALSQHRRACPLGAEGKGVAPSCSWRMLVLSCRTHHKHPPLGLGRV